MNKISLFFLLSLLYACQSKKNSKLVFIKETQTNDTIQAGTSKTFNYILKNEGDSVINILDFRLSCDCTNTNLKKGLVIKPKSTKAIYLTVETSKHEANKNKKLFLTIKANTNPQLTSIEIPVYIK